MASSQEIYKSFAIGSVIAGLSIPISFVLSLIGIVSGLQYIGTGLPAGYETRAGFTDFVLASLPYSAFFLAGLIIGKRIGRNGFKYGSIFSLLWTFLLLVSIIFSLLNVSGGIKNLLPKLVNTGFFVNFILYIMLPTLPAVLGAVVGEKVFSRK